MRTAAWTFVYAGRHLEATNYSPCRLPGHGQGGREGGDGQDISRMRKRRHLQLLPDFRVTCARCPIYNQIRSTYLGVEIGLQSDTANLDLWSYMKWIFD